MADLTQPQKWRTPIERLADLIAGRIFHQTRDAALAEELKRLLIEFSEEIKRSAVEP